MTAPASAGPFFILLPSGGHVLDPPFESGGDPAAAVLDETPDRGEDIGLQDLVVEFVEVGAQMQGVGARDTRRIADDLAVAPGLDVGLDDALADGQAAVEAVAAAGRKWNCPRVESVGIAVSSARFRLAPEIRFASRAF